MSNKKRVAFVHLDLGIGGAEQLIAHAARGLKRAGHDVVIYTSFFDPKRCFPGLSLAPTAVEEAAGDVVQVIVRGSWLPRTILGVCTLLCSVLRMLWLSWCLPRSEYDVLVNDQVSNVNPWLRRITRDKLVFYCHFPDLLLCVERRSWLKRAYRSFFDAWERRTMADCDVLCVNSEFTKEVLAKTFPHEFATIDTHVLYPPVDLAEVAGHRGGAGDEASRDALQPARGAKAANGTTVAKATSAPPRPRGRSSGAASLAEDASAGAASSAASTAPDGIPSILRRHNFFVSLNRYERKKEVELALDAFRILIKNHPEETRGLYLVVAGGYDTRVRENVEYARELRARAEQLDLLPRVVFLKSVSAGARWWLLGNALALVYTPRNEHFGIVPVEAMALGTCVVASDSGGPRESVANVGGYLVDHHAAGFYEGLCGVLRQSPEERATQAKAAIERVDSTFSLDAFSENLNRLILTDGRRSKKDQ